MDIVNEDVRSFLKGKQLDPKKAKLWNEKIQNFTIDDIYNYLTNEQRE